MQSVPELLTWWPVIAAAVLVGAYLAPRIGIPEAVAWCVSGVIAGVVPGFPRLEFDPHVALLLFLPPLVYASAVALPWPDFRAELRPITTLAVGLVACTTAAVAVAAHELAALPWAAAVALGAICSPTDPVAASAVAEKVGLPQRLIVILEGEGLMNDAVSLTILSIAEIAILTGHFSIAGGVLRFFAILLGELAYGLAIGYAVTKLREVIENPEIEIAISLLTPFVAYLVPQKLGGSGILAALVTGVYVGERRASFVPAGTRLKAIPVWGMMVFLLNGVLFFAAGMELERVIAGSISGSHVLRWGLAIAGTVVAVRAAWTVITRVVLRLLRTFLPIADSPLPPRQIAILAWSGMRGPISLAAALALPAALKGHEFPEFQTILFITAAVVVGTLLVQGSALTPLVHLLGVSGDAANDHAVFASHELLGSREAARAALDELAHLEQAGVCNKQLADHLRNYYDMRLNDPEPADDPDPDSTSERLRRKLIETERRKLMELRDSGQISDHALMRLQRGLDLREGLLD